MYSRNLDGRNSPAGRLVLELFCGAAVIVSAACAAGFSSVWIVHFQNVRSSLFAGASNHIGDQIVIVSCEGLHASFVEHVFVCVRPLSLKAIHLWAWTFLAVST